MKSSVNESDWSEDHWRAERLSVYVTAGVGFARWTSLTVDFFAKLRAVFADADKSEHCIIMDARSVSQSTHNSRVDHGFAIKVSNVIVIISVIFISEDQPNSSAVTMAVKSPAFCHIQKFCKTVIFCGF